MCEVARTPHYPACGSPKLIVLSMWRQVLEYAQNSMPKNADENMLTCLADLFVQVWLSPRGMLQTASGKRVWGAYQGFLVLPCLEAGDDEL